MTDSSFGIHGARHLTLVAPVEASPNGGATARTRRAASLLLVCSSGGHLTQLYNLRSWWERFERTWVTFAKPDATSLLTGERTVWAYHPTTRNVWNLLRNTVLAWRLIRRERPNLIVSTGAGVAFPFFLIGKLHGARTAYVEVFDRVDSPTMTGRLCYPISDRFLLQLDEQKAMYPKGQVVGPLL